MCHIATTGALVTVLFHQSFQARNAVDDTKEMRPDVALCQVICKWNSKQMDLCAAIGENTTANNGSFHGESHWP